MSRTLRYHRGSSGVDQTDSGTNAGVCGVNHVNSVARFANLGYWSRTSLSGRGIAPAAVLAVGSGVWIDTTSRAEITVA